MAYRELIKNFENIRSCMRDFYVYGFKPRSAFTDKSLRSYDDEKRRLESWLGDYMSFRWDEGEKTVFLSVDSRQPQSNPLFMAWKSRSFTDCDITLHFIISDIFYCGGVQLSCGGLLQIIERDYLSVFENSVTIDQSTLRKKLKEYVDAGLLSCTQNGNKILYSRAVTPDICLNYPLLSFYSEVAPCGAIGSFLLDRVQKEYPVFAFKHHYITQTLDADILLTLLQCIRERRGVKIELLSRHSGRQIMLDIIPVKIFVSVQNGRQYVIAYKGNRMQSYRIDRIKEAKSGAQIDDYNKYSDDFNRKRRHMWGASVRSGKLEHVEFSIKTEEGEEYIYRRLLREKRIGQVYRADKNTCVFCADVYDSIEMLPWIRTFICRIISIKADNPALVTMLKKDFEDMCALYGAGGGNDI